MPAYRTIREAILQGKKSIESHEPRNGKKECVCVSHTSCSESKRAQHQSNKGTHAKATFSTIKCQGVCPLV